MNQDLSKPATSLALSKDERQQIAAYEARIARGIETFLDVGAALADIRDSHLYREEFPSFEAYCQGKWQLGKRRAYQLMIAAGVASDMGKIFPMSPQRESHATALAKIDPDHREAVWERVLAQTDKPTAALIATVHSAYLAELLAAQEAVIEAGWDAFAQVLAARRTMCRNDPAALQQAVQTDFPQMDSDTVATIIRVFLND